MMGVWNYSRYFGEKIAFICKYDIIYMLRILIVFRVRFAFGKNAGFGCHILIPE